MSGQIRMDYAATMSAAQQLKSVSELVKDAQAKNSVTRSALGSWEGVAAAKGKVLLARVSDALKSYDASYWQAARFFVNAAEQLTASDESVAQALKAQWDGAYDPSAGRT